jgi:hypothetical protein
MEILNRLDKVRLAEDDIDLIGFLDLHDQQFHPRFSPYSRYVCFRRRLAVGALVTLAHTIAPISSRCLQP